MGRRGAVEVAAEPVEVVVAAKCSVAQGGHGERVVIALRNDRGGLGFVVSLTDARRLRRILAEALLESPPAPDAEIVLRLHRP